MNKTVKRVVIGAGIAVGSVVLTMLMGNIQFFRQVDLKAQDAHFVLRGKLPEKKVDDFRIIYIDDEALGKYAVPTLFWQPIYADTMRAVADGGGKVMVLDVAFQINVAKYAPDNDSILAGAFAEVSPRMPIICAAVPIPMDQQTNPDFAVPLNMMASVFGTSAFPNLTADSDDFIRRQELIEEPKKDTPPEALTRGMALRAAEKYLGKDATYKGGRFFLGDKEIQTDAARNLTINYAGPPYTFPRISVAKVVEAFKSGNHQQLKKWFDGKVVLLGPDSKEDRRPTPFYTAFSSDIWTTPGVEVHASVIRTLLSGEYLKPVPESMRIAALAVAASICVAIAVSFAVTQTLAWASLALILLMGGTHLLFRQGQLLSTSQILLAFVWALLGGIVYRFATAEKKSTFFRNAIGLFVGKQVATSMEQSEKISLIGKRELVTILFTDIRGFTAYSESKDPAVVVDNLNIYMSIMVGIIVKNGGHVNKFMGDGILAVFSDEDAGAKPGDHAIRCCRCAQEMVEQVIGDFHTGSGFHTGEVIIGNVGSADKLEFTVLGNTVNMASRLESLNKELKARLVMSTEAREMLHGEFDTIYMGGVPVKGKTTLMDTYTVTALLDDARIAELRAKYPNGAPVQDTEKVA
ncbi:MAG TPA: adenylate/guanylate cyclase domain-containing protein [Bryobacteraceae bacterium]|nr:adenylate/guanylate cyclase domain-containing protein [Bryobacteraceae bacterium]